MHLIQRVSFVSLLVVFAAANSAFAQGGPEDIRLTVGKSIVIDYPTDISRISTSNAEIVDASPVTAREILVHGKAFGTVTLVVWSKAGQRMFYNVTVDLNLDPLRRLLKESFPNDNIEPRSSRDSISLNGRMLEQPLCSSNRVPRSRSRRSHRRNSQDSALKGRLNCESGLFAVHPNLRVNGHRQEQWNLRNARYPAERRSQCRPCLRREYRF